MMRTKLQVGAGELFVEMPQQILDRVGVKVGDKVEIAGDDRQIEISAVNRDKDELDGAKC
jgi:antitoxin component of MazEF toxin-antitoxin module